MTGGINIGINSMGGGTMYLSPAFLCFVENSKHELGENCSLSSAFQFSLSVLWLRDGFSKTQRRLDSLV